MGLQCGHRRCIFPCSNELGMPQISGLQALGQNICVSVPSVRTEPCSLGIYKGNKTHKKAASSSSDSDLLLPGRLHSFCSNSFKVNGSIRQNLVPSAKSGVQDQLGQVQFDSCTSGRVSRRDLEPQELFSFCSTGKTHSTQSPVLGDVPENYVHKEGVGKLNRFDKLCRNLCRVREAPSSSLDVVGKPSHSTLLQRQICSTRFEIQGVAENMDVSNILRSSSSYAHISALSHLDDGRVFGRLVWNSATTQGSWILGTRSFPILYELEGAQSNFSISRGVPDSFEGQDCTSSVGQYHSNLLPKESGFSSICTPAQPFNGNSGILQEDVYCPSPGTSEGSVECLGRSGLSSPPSSHGVVPRQGDLQLGVVPCSSFSGGSVCHSGEQPNSTVCVPLPRRLGSGGKRFQFRLESLDIHLPLPSRELSGGSSKPPPEVRRNRSDDSALLAIEGMVSSSSSSLSSSSSSPPRSVHTQSDDFERPGFPRQSVFLEPSRLDSVSKPWEADLSEDSVRILRNNHREGTVRQYQGIWKKFLEFLSENNISHEKVSVFVVMNFLSHHFVVFNRKFRTIAAYKCALTHPLFVNFGIDFKDARLDMYMRGVFNSKPPVPSAPMPIWSLNHLLSFLASDYFEPLYSKDLYLVAQKTLCLLLLATGRRIGEIANLSKKHSHSRMGDVITIQLLPGFFPKHCDQSFQPEVPSFERLDSDIISELWLCPVRAFNTYLGKIGGGPRFSINSSLWSYDVRGLTKMLQTTVLQSRQFGGDMEIVPMGPHQIRKLAASYSAQLIGSSPEGQKKLMERMGCSSMSVLRRVYIKDVPSLNFKCVLPVGTFIPSSD